MAKTIPYVGLNTEKNRNRKWLQKWNRVAQMSRLMNNPVYGKTMKILRNIIVVRLVSNNNNNNKKYLKWTSKPSYVTKILDSGLVAIYKSKSTLKLNKAAYVGMFMLDLSKLLMYEFHHDYIKDKYGNNSRILFNDIDGLMYEMKT